jgi:allantoin racemase
VNVVDLETVKEQVKEYLHEHAGEFAAALAVVRTIQGMRSPERRRRGMRSAADRGTRIVVLINPNASAAATESMTDAARRITEDGFEVRGVTVAEPRDAVSQILGAALRARTDHVDAFVVAGSDHAGVEQLRAAVQVPVVGAGEAALLETAGRRFGVAAATSDLAASVAARVEALGLTGRCTGIRDARANPPVLGRDREALSERLAAAATRCVHQDGAEAVVLADDPLGATVDAPGTSFAVPLVSPVPAACRKVRALLG